VYGDAGEGVEPRRRVANLATAYILDKKLNAMAAAGELGLTREPGHPRPVTDQLISMIPGERRGSDTIASMLTPLIMLEVTRPREFFQGPPPREHAPRARVLVLLTEWYNYMGSTILLWIDNSGDGRAAVTADVSGDAPGQLPGHVEHEHFTPGMFAALDQRAGDPYRWVSRVDWTQAPDRWARPGGSSA
jgi:hypothetical protein